MDSSCFSQLETNSSFVDPSSAISTKFYPCGSSSANLIPSLNGRTIVVSSSSSTLVARLSNHSLWEEISFIPIRKDGKIRRLGKVFGASLVAPARFTISAATSFQIIPSLPASNYKRQLYVPSLQWIMPLILENTGEERTWTAKSARRWDVRSSKRKKEGLSDALRAVIVHWLLGDTLECRRISSLPAVGRNSMGAPPKGIPTYLLEAPDLPSASCLCLRRKRYFFGYYPVAGVESCWCVPASPRLSLRNTCV